MHIEVNKRFFGEDTFKIIDMTPVGKAILNITSLCNYERCALQIDGGGIKGILPAYKLYVTEKQCNSKINEYVTDYFGTSTGSIVVASLYLDISTAKILRFYIEEGPSVFHDRNIFGKLFRGSLFKAKKLEETLQTLYGQVTFAQAYKMTKGKTLNIATVSRLERKTIICNHKNTPDMPIWKAVRASTAAPSYFPPFRWKNKVLLDGGTATHNSLLEKTMDYYLYDMKLAPRDFYILSLGCGKAEEPPVPTEWEIDSALKTSKIGALKYAVLYGREETITRQVKKMKHLRKEIKLKAKRWDIVLPKELDKLAETDNIDELIELAETD